MKVSNNPIIELRYNDPITGKVYKGFTDGETLIDFVLGNSVNIHPAKNMYMVIYVSYLEFLHPDDNSIYYLSPVGEHEFKSHTELTEFVSRFKVGYKDYYQKFVNNNPFDQFSVIPTKFNFTHPHIEQVRAVFCAER